MNYLHEGYPEERSLNCPDIETRAGNYEYVHKIAMIGDTGVGKTSLVNQYRHGAFDPEIGHTIGADFIVRSLNSLLREKLQVWDTAGMERFRTITRGYYRNVQAIMLVYDVTRVDTFDSLPQWLDDVGSNVEVMPIMFIVGNKTDLCNGPESRRMVPTETGRQFALERGCPFMEVSAKDDTNVDEVFQTAVEHMRNRAVIREISARSEKGVILLDEEANITAQPEESINGGCWC